MRYSLQPGVLVASLVVCFASMGGLRYLQLREQIKLPEPRLGSPVGPVLATVYWIHPPQANIAVLINAMYNTPGDEGVDVFVSGGAYEVMSPIKIGPRDSLFGRPAILLQVSSSFSYDYLVDSTNATHALIDRVDVNLGNANLLK